MEMTNSFIEALSPTGFANWRLNSQQDKTSCNSEPWGQQRKLEQTVSHEDDERRISLTASQGKQLSQQVYRVRTPATENGFWTTHRRQCNIEPRLKTTGAEKDRRPPWKPSRAASRASANCGKEMIRVRVMVVFYIFHAWSGNDNMVSKSKPCKGSFPIVPA